MTNGNNMHKSLLFLFSTTLILLVVFSSGCTIPEPRTIYSYTVTIETEGDAHNITLIVPMPYYEGEVYSEIVTNPNNSNIYSGENISYDIIDTKYGNMLRIQSPKNGSFGLMRYGDHYPVNNTPWISGEDPILYPRFNQTPVTIERKPGEVYDTRIYASFDGGANASIEVKTTLTGVTTRYESSRYYDDVISDPILHNESGEWIRVECEGYS